MDDVVVVALSSTWYLFLLVLLMMIMRMGSAVVGQRHEQSTTVGTTSASIGWYLRWRGRRNDILVHVGEQLCGVNDGVYCTDETSSGRSGTRTYQYRPQPDTHPSSCAREAVNQPRSVHGTCVFRGGATMRNALVQVLDK